MISLLIILLFAGFLLIMGSAFLFHWKEFTLLTAAYFFILQISYFLNGYSPLDYFEDELLKLHTNLLLLIFALKWAYHLLLKLRNREFKFYGLDLNKADQELLFLIFLSIFIAWTFAIASIILTGSDKSTLIHIVLFCTACFSFFLFQKARDQLFKKACGVTCILLTVFTSMSLIFAKIVLNAAEEHLNEGDKICLYQRNAGGTPERAIDLSFLTFGKNISNFSVEPHAILITQQKSGITNFYHWSYYKLSFVQGGLGLASQKHLETVCTFKEINQLFD